MKSGGALMKRVFSFVVDIRGTAGLETASWVWDLS